MSVNKMRSAHHARLARTQRHCEHAPKTCEQARLRGRYGRFRVMKSEPVGYLLQVHLLRPLDGREWVTIELYLYLANARAIARQLDLASSPQWGKHHR